MAGERQAVPGPEQDWTSIHQAVIRVRFWVLGISLFALLVTNRLLPEEYPVFSLAFLLAGLGLNAGYRRLAAGSRYPAQLLLLALILDLAVVTGFLRFVGGASHLASFFFLLPVLGSAFLEFRQGLLIALLACACYSNLALQIHYDKVFASLVDGLPPPQINNVLNDIAAWSAGLCAIGVISRAFHDVLRTASVRSRWESLALGRSLKQTQETRDSLQQAVRDLQAMSEQIINAFVAAIETKDPYTRGHSERVALYAERIARVLNLPEERVARLRYAALLHDVGKIGIHVDILRKPGPLSDEEYEEIKNHPDYGVRILKNIGTMLDILPYIRHHHERFAGGGYVSGLAGNAIPLEARILAVADAFEAIQADRAYRRGVGLQNAIREIVRGRGTQFDPLVVEAFLRAMGGEPPPENVSEPMSGLGAGERP